MLTLPGLCRIWGTKAGLIMGGGGGRNGGTRTDISNIVTVNETSEGKEGGGCI